MGATGRVPGGALSTSDTTRVAALQDQEDAQEGPQEGPQEEDFYR